MTLVRSQMRIRQLISTKQTLGTELSCYQHRDILQCHPVAIQERRSRGMGETSLP